MELGARRLQLNCKDQTVYGPLHVLLPICLVLVLLVGGREVLLRLMVQQVIAAEDRPG